MQEVLPLPGEVHNLPDGSRLMSRPACAGMGALEAIHLPPPGELGERLQVWGEAHIRQPGAPGTCHVPRCGCGELHIVARNKIVITGINHIMNRAFKAISADSATTIGIDAALASNDLTHSYIRVGTGGSTTNQGTTGLTTAVTVNPTSTSGGTIDFATSGVRKHSFTATWNAGTLTAALGSTPVTEIGIFGLLNDADNEAPDCTTSDVGNASALSLFSRLSVADSEFSSFVVNHAVPLVIEHRITMTFT